MLETKGGRIELLYMANEVFIFVTEELKELAIWYVVWFHQTELLQGDNCNTAYGKQYVSSGKV